MTGRRPCFIRSLDGDWLQLEDCVVKVTIRRRLQREVNRDGEGDDIIDQGSESAEYSISGRADEETYHKILAISRSGSTWMIEPFEEVELKVGFARLNFDSESGNYEIMLIQDAV